MDWFWICNVMEVRILEAVRRVALQGDEKLHLGAAERDGAEVHADRDVVGVPPAGTTVTPAGLPPL